MEHHQIIPEQFTTPKRSRHQQFRPEPSQTLGPLTCFLPLWICLFWAAHKNGIIWDLIFCVWLDLAKYFQGLQLFSKYSSFITF